MGRCTATNKATGRKCKYQALPGKRKCGHHTKSKGKGTVSMLHSEKTREEILGMVMTKAASASKDKLLKALEVLNASSAGPSRVIKRKIPSVGGEKIPRKKVVIPVDSDSEDEGSASRVNGPKSRGNGPPNWTNIELQGFAQKGFIYGGAQRSLPPNLVGKRLDPARSLTQKWYPSSTGTKYEQFWRSPEDSASGGNGPEFPGDGPSTWTDVEKRGKFDKRFTYMGIVHGMGGAGGRSYPPALATEYSSKPGPFGRAYGKGWSLVNWDNVEGTHMASLWA